MEAVYEGGKLTGGSFTNLLFLEATGVIRGLLLVLQSPLWVSWVATRCGEINSWRTSLPMCTTDGCMPPPSRGND